METVVARGLLGRTVASRMRNYTDMQFKSFSEGWNCQHEKHRSTNAHPRANRA